jgi:hypothetical protein
MEKDMSLVKEEIKNYIKEKGPCLPTEIAKIIGEPLLITNAILSEMVDDKILKISHMKIGSSPLYFLEGQEPLLENYIQYLSDIERESIKLLKEKKILDNSQLIPSVKLALTQLPDFAIPLKIKVSGEEKIIWKYFLVSDSEVKNLLKGKIEKVEVKKREEPKGKRKKELKSFEKVEKNEFEEYIVKNFEIVKKVSKDMYIINSKILDENLRFLVLIKNKKKLSDLDVFSSLKEGEERRMPVIILTKGELTKKAKELKEKYGNILIIKKI